MKRKVEYSRSHRRLTPSLAADSVFAVELDGLDGEALSYVDDFRGNEEREL